MHWDWDFFNKWKPTILIASFGAVVVSARYLETGVTYYLVAGIVCVVCTLALLWLCTWRT